MEHILIFILKFISWKRSFDNHILWKSLEKQQAFQGRLLNREICFVI